MKRFLMISPYYMPMNYVGAKRTLCFTRHLPDLGWSPAVVALPETIEPDEALAELVPDVPMFRGYRGGPLAWVEDVLAPMKYRRPYAGGRQGLGGRSTPGSAGPLARLLREVSLLPVDRFTKYLPWSLAGSLALLRRQRCEAIFATAGPFSSMLLGALLVRLTGLPLVLDLRDPYALDPIYSARWTPLGHRMALAKERWCFDTAARVVLNTERSLDHYRRGYAGRLPAERFAVIRNHFDPELFDPLPPPPGPDGPFTVIFFGHLTPIRNACLFLEGLRVFLDREALRPGEARFITLGMRTGDDEGQIRALALEPYVEAHPWLPFTRCRSLLGRADVLLDLTSSEHHLRISGKFYDYLACERPILCLSENPEMTRILKETGAGQRIESDPQAVAAALSERLADKRAGRPFAPDRAAVFRYSARPAAEKLAAILDEVTR